ncbi:EamA family transporter [Arenimonas sp.]|jgi:drug/metabolite transporter (DMT)-like permease|uniref:EamA family transporter n=1 Tax=Arenimonas sp. TaxID=1872635 RepID=UPI0037BF9E34
MSHSTVERKAFWQIHFCVLLWGFTAILGKLITLPAQALVVWRMVLVAMLLAVLPRVWRGLRVLSPRLIAIYAGIGIIVALHWLTFYGAIKLSNASVAVSCLALGSIFTAIIEPMLTGKPHARSEILLGLMVIPGVYLLIGGVPLSMHLGIAVGILSSLLTAVFATLNKRYVHEADPESVTFIEMSVGALALAGASALYFGVDATFIQPDLYNFSLLLVLAVLCTLLPFILSLHALRHISAFSTQLALNLEPVYAIVIAALWLKEYQELTPQFYLGVAIILSAVFVQPLLLRKRPA